MSNSNQAHRWWIGAVGVPLLVATIGAGVAVYLAARDQPVAAETALSDTHSAPAQTTQASTPSSAQTPATPRDAQGALRRIQGDWSLPPQGCRFPVRIEVISNEIIVSQADGPVSARYRVMTANDDAVHAQRDGATPVEFLVYSDSLHYSGRVFERCP
ncbi:MAG: hypothetical protein H7124_08200 [Phycisphaerales bacterium]|nr:hypothetical protein [Hyphomonadaceae bacterium]